MSPGILVDPPRTRSSALTDTISLNDAVSNAPHSFLQPSPELHQACLEVAKQYLDPLAKTVSECQLARLQDARRKRKRNEREDFLTRDILRLKQLHLDGFSVDQIWEQARRVIDASQRETERVVRRTDSPARSSKQPHQARFEQDESESDGMETDLEEAPLDEATNNGYPEILEDHEEKEPSDDIPLEDIEDDSEMSDGIPGERREQYTKDPNGLNDGFFSIDEFNRQTEFLEHQDAKGDPDDGAASDEEEVDWSVDPANAPLAKSLQPTGEDSAEEYSEDDHDPALGSLGNADLDAPFSEGEDDEDEDMELEMGADENPLANTNDIFYKDFFKPPPQPPSKKSKRPLPKTQPERQNEPEDIYADMERTMSAVKRDIFEDDDEDSQISDAEGEEGRNLSSHERRQAALAAQIRKLESEAVAKREWAMSGEARATDRPLNSLLEEDLEFERTGKPVPVVTAEVSSSIEELIKQRILARQFDEVAKRLPGSADLRPPTRRRGLVDIDERGPDQSLAAIYEAEHLQRTDPNYVDPRDAKLKAAHAEIEKLWADVSTKLDALSNWHYRPKPPAVEVSVVSDAPRIAMEDARPSGVGLAAEESGLAPQEVYKAGTAREKGEVATKAGTLLGKGELSREEKQRHFRREKERERKKKGEVAEKSETEAAAKSTAKTNKGEKASSHRDLAENLKRGGVKVIGKGGEIVDVEGKKVKGKTSSKGGGSYKL